MPLYGIRELTYREVKWLAAHHLMSGKAKVGIWAVRLQGLHCQP